MKNKMYKVPLYEISYQHLETGKLSYVDTIIVKKNIGRIKEVMTDYDDIDLINQYYLKNGKLDYYSRKPIKAKEVGHHLVVFTEDLIEDNKVQEKDIANYVSGYLESEWNKMYHDLHILTKEEKKAIKKRDYSR